jgi:hypothetical protein
MSNQFGNGSPQRMFAADAEAIAPLERRLQMAVVLLSQLAGKENKQGLRCRLQVSKGRAIYHPMMNRRVWVLCGRLGGRLTTPGLFRAVSCH